MIAPILSFVVLCLFSCCFPPLSFELLSNVLLSCPNQYQCSTSVDTNIYKSLNQN